MTDEFTRMRDRARELITPLNYNTPEAKAIDALLECIEQIAWEVDTIRFRCGHPTEAHE